MPKTQNIAGWPVMPASCKTCPFGPHGDPTVRERVTERIVSLSCSQICHHPALLGMKENRLCRGARDLQLRILCVTGMIDAPTDESFNRKANELKGGITKP